MTEGPLVWPPRVLPPAGAIIQLVYDNKFPSIWEYRDAVTRGDIDFALAIGSTCPICSNPDCYRKITGYTRGVIDLYPTYREGRVPIARFQCTTKWLTFSLLPVQLLPYHRYTLTSIALVL